MDDFGTGYSSLSCLESMPFDVIKIDRSFINEFDTRPGARLIVQAILGLGRALGLPVTAEGVETNEQLALLTADQCSEVQGFLMARPLKAEQIDALLAEIPILAGSGAMKTLAGLIDAWISAKENRQDVGRSSATGSSAEMRPIPTD